MSDIFSMYKDMPNTASGDAVCEEYGTSIASLVNEIATLKQQLEEAKAENEALASGLRGKHATTGATYAHLIAQRDQLKQQNAELLKALKKFIDSHEECTDFDGFTAQIVSMDDYHEAQETIASAEGK